MEQVQPAQLKDGLSRCKPSWKKECVKVMTKTVGNGAHMVHHREVTMRRLRTGSRLLLLPQHQVVSIFVSATANSWDPASGVHV